MIVSTSPASITPGWISRFETNVQTLIQDAWARRAQSLKWDQLMAKKTSSAGREIIFWLLETAKIVDEGYGGNKRFDDVAATFFEVVNKDAGIGLRLTSNEIKDNQMRTGQNALDYAAIWANRVGKNGAYWPQQQLISLLTNGTTNLAYDGVAFFSTAHPVNPFSGGSATYSNRISGHPLKVVSGTAFDLPTMAKNLNDVLSAVQSGSLQPNGLPRDVVFKYIVGGPDMRMPLQMLLDAKTFGGGAYGPSENIISTWGMEPIIFPEITEAGVAYLIAEPLPDEGGAFIYQEREPFTLSSYSTDSLAELQRRKEFEWMFDGRNAAYYGHPYLAVRVEAT